MADDVGAPKTVDRGTFQAELDALQAREKAHTREGDAIAAARRRLPMVEVDAANPRRGAGPPHTCGRGVLWIAPVIGMKNTPMSRREWIFPSASFV